MANPEAESDGAPANPGAGMKTLGGRMVAVCFVCMFLGRTVVSAAFPELKGKGIPPAMWFVLVPIWAVGIIGLGLMLAGWVRGKTAEPGAAPDRGGTKGFPEV